MPRFEPHPARRPAVVAGASSGIGAATATELAARGFWWPWAPAGWTGARNSPPESRAGGGEAVALPLDVTDPDSVRTFIDRAGAELGDIEVLVAGAGDTFRSAPRDRDRGLRGPTPDPSDRGQPAGHRGPSRNGGPAARRCGLHRLRRRPAPAPAHGRLRRRESRTAGDGDQPADGTRGYQVRAAIVHPGRPRPGWAGACRRRPSPRPWRIGRSGDKPATPTSCEQPTWPGPSRSSCRARAGVCRLDGDPARGTAVRRARPAPGTEASGGAMSGARPGGPASVRRRR